MLMIRFARIGKKKQPSYRLVVSEKARDMYGRALEIIGNYNPRTKAVEIQKERISHWLSQGAQPSDTVRNLLISQGLMEGKKSPVTHINKKKQAKLKAKVEKDAADAQAKAEKEAAVKAEQEAPAEKAVVDEPQAITEDVSPAPADESAAETE